MAFPRVLLVEDDPPMAQVYGAYLRKDSIDVVHVDTGAKALAALEHFVPDAILLDLHLPDMNGMEVLRRRTELQLPSPTIILTAHGSVKTAVEAMQNGAVDFIMKPFTAERLLTTLKNALEQQKLRETVNRYKESEGHRSFGGFIGSSPQMQAIYRMIAGAAPSKASVFITGESGTGKELCAEAIHRLSRRPAGKFLPLNCSAIPGELMESEVFGHVKGAFSGAVADRIGAAEAADGGTLFLDEICEMDLALQAKFLRFIQSGMIQRVGSNKQIPVDVRFVCATNRNPQEEVRAGRFREDLFFRLHVIPIHLPPLREREEDVIEIARDLLRRFAEQEGKAFTGLSPDAIERLQAHAWPGNVRELHNALYNAVVLHDGPLLTAAMLPVSAPALRPQPLRAEAAAMPASTLAAHPPVVAGGAPPAGEPPRIRPMWQVERDMIVAAIAACRGNVPRAAALLEVSPSTVYRRIREMQAEGIAIPFLQMG